MASFAAVVTMRSLDSRSATIDAGRLRPQTMGVYTNAPGRVAIEPLDGAELTAAGLSAPEGRWDVEVSLGPTSSGRITYVQLASEYWTLNVSQPIAITLQLPQDAVLRDPPRALRADSQGTCASWYDGNRTRYATPAVRRDFYGYLIVRCAIPRLGRVSDLFFDVGFEWPDRTWTKTGFGRHTAALKFEDLPTWDLEMSDMPPGDDNLVLQPLRAEVVLPSGTTLTDAFPPPDGGGVALRSWKVDDGTELQFHLERAASRTLVEPGVDIALIIGGFSLALIRFPRRTR